MSYKLDSAALSLIFKKIKETMVSKENGKGLSTNDYTNAEKNKVAAIPTKTSDLDNDSGFITTSDIPEGSAATSTVPKMAGTAALGTEMAFARGDHVHPSDTSRVPTSRKVNGKDLSADITLSASDVGAATTDYVDSKIADSVSALTTEAIDAAWNNA